MNTARPIFSHQSVKRACLIGCVTAALSLSSVAGLAQVNSGSDGHDGIFSPATDTVINMADHPDGIYQYTSVTISNGITVTFIPNASNSPVVWLVQGDCVIAGAVDVSGQSVQTAEAMGDSGGPGGYRGGSAGSNPLPGQGPGGGQAGGGNASFGSLGSGAAGGIYGNSFLVPLLGGSGGGGGSPNAWTSTYAGGGGGGGAILIAASGQIDVSGRIYANGGGGGAIYYEGSLAESGGAGSGGAIRLVASRILTSSRAGTVSANGGANGQGWWGASGGLGRVRFDALEQDFGGQITGVFTQGFQPIILPVAGQGVQLAIESVGGLAVPANPSSNPANPAIIMPGQQANPIAIVVRCSNLPLNTLITVTVRPVNGSPVSAAGYNNTGTQTSSTATVSLNMPRGGGIVYATAATGN